MENTRLCYIPNTGIKIHLPRAMPEFSDTRHHKMNIISKLNAAPLRFIIVRNRYIDILKLSFRILRVFLYMVRSNTLN